MRSIQFLVLMALLFPVFRNARTTGQSSTCLSHMKQVTQSTLLYAQDYDGNLPPPLTASNTPFPYIQNRSLLVCPEVGHNTVSYTLNPNLKNLNFHTMAWPEKTILVYEGKANTIAYRHSDRAMIGFADGHCKSIASQDATAFFWTPQAPPNLLKLPVSLPPEQPDKAGSGSEVGGPVYMR